MSLDPEVESTGTREQHRADEAFQTATQEVVHTANEINRFEAALNTFVKYHERNHFRENALKIMRSPSRRTVDDAA